MSVQKQKTIVLTICACLLIGLYLTFAAVSAYAYYTEGIPLVAGLVGIAYVLVALGVSVVLARFCRKGRFGLSWHDYSVLTLIALCITTLSACFAIGAWYDSLYEFLLVLLDALPTLSLGLCFGVSWLIFYKK